MAASGPSRATSATLDDVTFAFDRPQSPRPACLLETLSTPRQNSTPPAQLTTSGYLIPSLCVFIFPLPAARQRRIHSMSGILSSLVMGDRRARTSDAVLNIVTAGALVRRLLACPVAMTHLNCHPARICFTDLD